MKTYLLGIDLGSSSVKAALVELDTHRVCAQVQAPDTEMDIQAPKPGWAEQDPEMWWQQTVRAVQKALKTADVSGNQVVGIGISYQMHGLVLVDDAGMVLRPSIIWCDSRAVEIGKQAYLDLGSEYCNTHLLNSPGNFTASKLRWVQLHEPETFRKVRWAMLPGDYLAFRMSGLPATTFSGLSEGVFWDFKQKTIAQNLLECYQIDAGLIPEIVPAFGNQGLLTAKAAQELGLQAGIPIGYRAGDQPNNALSLNVLHPGDMAATGGTSGVMYGVVDTLAGDAKQRVNSFAHVNHLPEKPRIGILLCINGAGSQYKWMRDFFAGTHTPYVELEKMAAAVPVGAEGLQVLPFGNGAERMLENKNPGAHLLGIDFHRHGKGHFYRAALEGIAFSFVYGAQVLKDLGLNPGVVRAGNDNLFQSDIFSQTISNLLGCRIEVLQRNGAVGAALAAGFGLGIWSDLEEALADPAQVHAYAPATDLSAHQEAFENWKETLNRILIG